MYIGPLTELYALETVKAFSAYDFERALAFNEARAVTNTILAQCWGGSVFLAVVGYLFSGHFLLIPTTLGTAYMLARACWHGRRSLDRVCHLQEWCALDVQGRGDLCY